MELWRGSIPAIGEDTVELDGGFATFVTLEPV